MYGGREIVFSSEIELHQAVGATELAGPNVATFLPHGPTAVGAESHPSSSRPPSLVLLGRAAIEALHPPSPHSAFQSGFERG